MIVISDTSAISNLLTIDEIDILNITFGTIIIPSSVREELCRIENQRRFLESCDWINSAELSNRKLFNKLRQSLDRGESEAIALAVEKNADFLVIDEAKGRDVARSLGVNITGLPGLFVIAKEQGHIDFVRPYIERLVNEARFRLSKNIVEKVLELAGEK